MTDLHTTFMTEGRKTLQKTLGIKNVFAVPKLVKITINCGLGEALENKNAIEIMTAQIASMCGQKPVTTYAKRDISTFKLRRGEAIGIKVTLRGKRMYNFLQKLITIVFPRIRDFRGIDYRGFDTRGGYSLGFPEQVVFPEIEYTQVDRVRGLEVTFVTTGKNTESTKQLLLQLGMPFKKK